ncbi:MAG: thioredoxin 1 [Ascidiaceihabitans sp.]|jgi:thioredoxin-like negative regulator of GroEL
MNRRNFLMASATSLFLPISAHAYSFIPYTPAAWDGLKQSDQTVILNFRASWSLTCNQNLELIAQLVGQNSDYRNLTFVDVNWDHYGQSVMASRLKVKRHSTLIVMKKGVEVTRMVNEPYERKMRALLDAALAA